MANPNCPLRDCDYEVDQYASYEDSHKQVTRHLMGHLIEELRLLRAAIRPQDDRGGPKSAAPDPKATMPENEPPAPGSVVGSGPIGRARLGREPSSG